MRPAAAIAAMAAALALAAAAPAWARAPSIGVRTGSHAAFGRVVFDLGPGQRYTAAATDGHLLLDFPGSPELLPPGPAPRNVAGIAIRPGSADIALAQGAHPVLHRYGDRLVVDIFAPAPASGMPAPAIHAAGRPVTPAPQPRPAGPPAPLDARERSAAPAPPALAAGPPPPPGPPPGPAPSAPPPAQAAAQARPPTPETSTPAPVPAQAQAAQPPPPTPTAAAPPAQTAAAPPAAPPPPAAPSSGPPSREALALAAAPVADAPAVLLPFAPGTGAAAFRRGPEGIVVFDERRPVDMAALRGDPAFGAATIALLPAGTVLRVPLPARDVLALTRRHRGWQVAVVPHEAADTTPIRPRTAAGRLQLAAHEAGGVVSLPDTLTGHALLVGVQRAPGEAIGAARHLPEFDLLPTWQGVAVLPLADRVGLSGAPEGFEVGAGPGARLALGVPDGVALPVAEASALSRRWTLPDLPRPALLHRLQAAIAEAAATPVQARAARRVQVAQAMLALGMGAEAQSVLAVAAEDDGRAADRPDVIGLGAVAALLAGRPREATGLLDPRLSGTDEVAFWRAVLAAGGPGGAARAAPVFAATLKLPLAYPAPLRRRLLPLVAETLAAGGEPAAARALIADAGGAPGLDLARAMLADPKDPKTALALYDKLAAGRDQLVRARALRRAVALRLATGALTRAQAADALDAQLYAWRGDGRELRLRQRIATLRAASGAPRRALAMLRETAALFPAHAAELQSRMVRIFTDAIGAAGPHALAPLDLVALADENPDLIPGGEPGRQLAATLADRLIALDLPARAEPVLAHLIDGTPPGDARSELGGRLAAMQFAGGDATAALATLASTVHPGPLPPKLLESRTLTYARAAQAQGRHAQALDALDQLGTDAALDLRAGLQEAAKEWPGAVATLRRLARHAIPADGGLDQAQASLLLRLAGAAAQAGDEATLALLRERYTPRMPAGATADMFRLLTSRPVQGTSDLPGVAAQLRQDRAALASR